MKVDHEQARALLLDQAAVTCSKTVDMAWVKKFENFSQLCEKAGVRTHVAFMGTALLANALYPDLDLHAFKPTHAVNIDKAYAARSLCEHVLVPLAPDIGISIGVTGREPLNNQPYFRMTRLGDNTPIRADSREPFEYMCSLVRELEGSGATEAGKAALRSFIYVRRDYLPKYADYDGVNVVSPERLLQAIEHFVGEASENGRRAQGVAAGLIDAYAGQSRVDSGRVNDPSRAHPGDVCVLGNDNDNYWEKAIEVKDKPVKPHDIKIFVSKCAAAGVRDASLVLVSSNQLSLDYDDLYGWADGIGMGLTIFQGWPLFVDQCLYWASPPKPVAAGQAAQAIHARIVALETSTDGVELWNALLAV